MGRRGIRIEFERGFLRGFTRTGRAARNSSRIMGKLRRIQRVELDKFAKKEASPEGRWRRRASRSSSRAARRGARVIRGRTRQASKRRGARTAVRFSGGSRILGMLPSTVRTRRRQNELVSRSPVPWSGVHDVGGRVGRGSRIPARPFVFITPRTLREAADLGLENMLRTWRRP